MIEKQLKQHVVQHSVLCHLLDFDGSTIYGHEVAVFCSKVKFWLKITYSNANCRFPVDFSLGVSARDF